METYYFISLPNIYHIHMYCPDTLTCLCVSMCVCTCVWSHLNILCSINDIEYLSMYLLASCIYPLLTTFKFMPIVGNICIVSLSLGVVYNFLSMVQYISKIFLYVAFCSMNSTFWCTLKPSHAKFLSSYLFFWNIHINHWKTQGCNKTRSLIPKIDEMYIIISS